MATNNNKHSNSAISTKGHYCVTNSSNLLSLKTGFKTMTLTNLPIVRRRNLLKDNHDKKKILKA